MRHEKIAMQHQLEYDIATAIEQFGYYRDYLYEITIDDIKLRKDIRRDVLLDALQDLHVQAQRIKSLIDLNRVALKPVMDKIQTYHIKEMEDILKILNKTNGIYLKGFFYNMEELQYHYLEYLHLILDEHKAFKAHGLVVDIQFSKAGVEFKPRANLANTIHGNIKLIINTIFKFEGIVVSLYSMYICNVDKNMDTLWTLYREGLLKRMALTLDYLANKPELEHISKKIDTLLTIFLNEHDSIQVEMEATGLDNITGDIEWLENDQI